MGKKIIGVIGGGQLCRMMGEDISEKGLPYSLIALDPTPKCPADIFLTSQLVGDFRDEDKIRKLARLSDVLTYEIDELVNRRVLEQLQIRGKSVHPDPEVLRVIQDKYVQVEFLKDHGIPVPDSMAVEREEDLFKGIEMYGLPLMIKARRYSYDGNGNFVLRNKDQVDDVLEKFRDRKLMVQKYIDFDTEVSVIAARNTLGQTSSFPVGENIHGKDYNILLTTIVPARINKRISQKAQEIAEVTMNALKGAGVFGIEMLVAGEEVLINEIAPRVHNSGHYTIEACETSQFHQHLRAITGEDLGDTTLHTPVVMHNIIGGSNYKGPYGITYNGQEVIGTLQVERGVFIHNYGKNEVRPGRKMGHVTVTAAGREELPDLLYRSKSVQELINIESQK